ncbi:P-loop containing nucleoside triphosphate hydrolase protein [Schizophyllum amplum]|uniref:P-loop containing nucleoside triphosphate hydrolase protein n=1 Tax=Schizophyllum amplum TaxID=97359 RepID=A0A550C374_9AGAR|nr:P-loop containing nucleoside triphosphate hydrolase protein [Auriculariopsis ampla]
MSDSPPPSIVDSMSVPSSPSMSSSPEDDGVGLSNPQISGKSRAMLDLVNRLHAIGIRAEIDLPQIAVIGSQSAGKSSLIESISGITLPRAAGTCTRCPTECLLSRSSSPWQCIVTLRFWTDSKGQALAVPRSVSFGTAILERHLVEERIRRAQRAILNPNIPVDHFLADGYDADEPATVEQLTFSKNCIELKISGPDVADLSFCDLPGLIASVGRSGNTNDIQLVEGLCKSYIEKPSCVILLTVTCETDFENQPAYGLAKKYDKDGKRTVGVLTKPDRIPLGEETQWLSFIKNITEPLDNNWFCVKQPSSQDLKQGMTWKQARTRENEFFSSTSPWSDLDAIYQRYLRTSNLVERLSNILSELISKRLPEIYNEVQRGVESARESLSQLPKEPSKDPITDITTILHAFAMDVGQNIRGVPRADGLHQSIRPAQEKFRKMIRQTAPDFRPYEKRYKGKRTFSKPSFLKNEDGEDEEEEDESESEDSDSDGRPTPNFKFKETPSIGLFDQASSESTQADPSHVPETRETIYIDEVMRRAKNARARELPGNYPFVVQSGYIADFTNKWSSPAQALCDGVYARVRLQIERLTAQHFGSYGQGTLEHRAKVILQERLKTLLDQTKERIDWLVEVEQSPFTLNTHYLADYTDKFMSYYKSARQSQSNEGLMGKIRAHGSAATTSSPSYSPGRPRHAQALYSSPADAGPTGIEKILAGAVEVGITGTKAEDVARLLAPDAMEPALHVMADVRAYFQIAYKRFADNVPLAIDQELVRGIERRLPFVLLTGLHIHGPQGERICKELAEESPQVAMKREELRQRIERMTTASEELMDFGR